MVRRMIRRVSSVAMATFLWQHRGSVARTADLVRRLPQVVRAGDSRDAITEAKAIVALDRKVPTSIDIRITGVGDGAVTLRGNARDDSLDRARETLLGVSEVLDVRTDGLGQPTIDDVVAAP